MPRGSNTGRATFFDRALLREELNAVTAPPAPSGLVSSLMRRVIPAGQTERQRDAYMTFAEEWREQAYGRVEPARTERTNTLSPTPFIALTWDLSRPAQELSRVESRAMANGLEADWLRATSDAPSYAYQPGVAGNYISTSTVAAAVHDEEQVDSLTQASLERAINTINNITDTQAKPEQPKWNGYSLAAMDDDHLLNAAAYVQEAFEKHRRLEDLAFSRGMIIPKKIFSKKPVEEWVDIFLVELDKRAMKERNTT